MYLRHLNILLLVPCSFLRADAVDIQFLYETHQWFQLRDAIELTTPSPIYKVAVACAFSRFEACQREVGRFLTSSSTPEQACQARGLQFYSSIRAGRFRFAHQEWQKIVASNCDAVDSGNFIKMVAAFSRYPELSVKRLRPSVLQYLMEGGNIFVPVSVNGQRVEYMLDTGANISMLAESEAVRLGMRVSDVRGVHLGDVTGNGVDVQKVGIADRLLAGDIELRHVPFVILSDKGPICELPVGKRGVLGIQPILAFRTVRWNTAGMIRLAFQDRHTDIRHSNICFDELRLMAATGFAGRVLDAELDTGAVVSHLYSRFARDFPNLGTGEKESMKLTGASGAIQADIVKLPEVLFQLGAFQADLSPATVLLSEAGAFGPHVLLGLDVLNQASEVNIDFSSMLLTLSR